AMGILAAGIPVGGVLGLLLGGALEEIYGWRIAFMAVGLPGFACAVLVTRLKDPTRVEEPLTLRRVRRELEIGIRSFTRMFAESLVAPAAAIVVAWVLSVRYNVESALA